MSRKFVTLALVLLVAAALFAAPAGISIKATGHRAPAKARLTASHVRHGKDAKLPHSPGLAHSPKAAGGPDSLGYIYKDSNEPGGPAFSWVDITGTGTNMNLGDDDYFYSIPFSFTFYGTAYSNIAVGSNGTVYFQDIYLGLGHVAIPGTNSYGVDIFTAPYWTDLDASSHGAVYYQVIGSTLVVEFYQVPTYGTSDYLTFEVILDNNDNSVKFQYLDLADLGSDCTVGIQGSAAQPPLWGLQYMYNSSSLANNLAIVFTQYVPVDHDAKVASIDTPATAVVPPGVPFHGAWTVLNYGTNPESDFTTHFEIHDTTGALLYGPSGAITSPDTIGAGATRQFVAATDFTPDPFTRYQVVAYTELPGDLRPGNDTMRFSFRTWDNEASVSSITQPAAVAAPDADIIPAVVFHNAATQAADFWAYCAIDTAGSTTIYTDSVQVTGLSAGSDTTVTFATLAAPHQLGAYVARAWLVQDHDLNPANDAISKPFACSWSGWHAEDVTGSTAVQWAQSCTGGGSLWVIGGLADASGNLSSAFQRYTPGVGWTALADIPTSSFGGASAFIDGKIYVVGGLDGSFAAVSRTAIYDTLTGIWSTGTAPIDARGGIGGGMVGNKLYLVGGATSGSFPTDCPTYCYDPAADTAGGTPWTTLTACPRGTLILGAPFMPSNASNYVFVVGDYRGNSGYDGYRYEPAADTAGGSPWTVLPSTPADVGGMWPEICHDGTYLYVTGGDPVGGWSGSYSDKTYTWDEVNGWVDMGIALSSIREPSAGGILGNKLYTYGGTTGSGPFDPPPFEWTYLKGYTGVSQQYIQASVSPSRFALLPNRPNPMSRQTTFSYQLPQAAAVRLAVYSITGQLVRTVINGVQPAGFHSVTWNGRNNNGQQVAAGVYIYNLTSAGGSATRKLVMIK